MKASEKATRHKLEVRIRAEQLGQETLPEATVYVFDAARRLLASEPFNGKAVSLTITGDIGERPRLRVMVGPRRSEQTAVTAGMPPWLPPVLEKAKLLDRDADYHKLKRQGGVETSVRLDKDQNVADVVLVPSDWHKWLPCLCQVKGRLVKRVKMADGTIAFWGVSHACVLLYEVDSLPLLLQTLPEEVLFRVREELLDKLRRPPVPPRPETPLLRTTAKASSDQGTTQRSVELDAITYATSAVQLRQALIAGSSILRPVLCSLFELMSHLKKDLIKGVCTDDDGYFKTFVPYSCGGDRPDLYFAAGQCLDGSWQWLYHPGLRCHVHWNYTCGSEVILETTNPLARVTTPEIDVEPPPGISTWVMPYAVGNIFFQRIDDNGLTTHDYDATNVSDAPWGATLGFHVTHAQSIPTAAIRYYRWLIKRPGSSSFVDMAAPTALGIYRTFVDYDDSRPHKPPTFPGYFLGPQGKGGMLLYEFRPHQPPLLAGHTREWPGESFAGETYSAMVDTTTLANGLHHFRLELYNDSFVKVVPPGDFRFIRKELDSIDSHELSEAEGLIDGGFQFSLHIDNRACTAVINPPTAGDSSASTNCGFLPFENDDDIGITFEASHPGNFATFEQWIQRAATRVVGFNGEVGATDEINNLNRDGQGQFTTKIEPTTLLGTCPQAAFVEVLKVRAKATNGWVRLNYLDREAFWAFALTPETDPEP